MKFNESCRGTFRENDILTLYSVYIQECFIKTENYSGNTKMRRQNTRQELWNINIQNVDWQRPKNNWNIDASNYWTIYHLIYRKKVQDLGWAVRWLAEYLAHFSSFCWCLQFEMKIINIINFLNFNFRTSSPGDLF